MGLHVGTGEGRRQTGDGRQESGGGGRETGAISVAGLTRSFGSRVALDDLSFEVPAGQIFGFLGPNGAGKTTTIRILTGQLRASSGSCSVLGLDPARNGRELRARIGISYEEAGHYERLSVASNLGFFGKLYGLGPERCEELLKSFDLYGRRRDPVSKLSRGMRQRLALARALVGSPELLFLDEPTAGLDPLAARGVRNLIKSFCAGGKTVFLTTHSMEEAQELCQTVAILDRGKMLACDAPDALRNGSTLEEVFVRLTGRRLHDSVEEPGSSRI